MKKWLLKTLFKKEIKLLTDLINSQETQIKNLKLRIEYLITERKL